MTWHKNGRTIDRMQLLGLAESTPKTESRWRALFWPTIRNETDLDQITRQGFWICFAAAVFAIVGSLSPGQLIGVVEGAYFLLAGFGVRQRSRISAGAAFSSYLLAGFVMQRYTGAGFGVLRILLQVLLFANVRGIWLAARWPADSEARFISQPLNDTLGDKVTNLLPALLWPKLRYVFYVLAVLENAALLFLLFVPRG